jgi:quercetin dioxygenase-like cupin family protein
MKKKMAKVAILKFFVLCVTIGLISCNDVRERRDATVEKNTNLIFPKGEKITNDNFTGTAYLYSMIEGDSINPNGVGNVTFEPGARTKWHVHPAGQILLATDGVGYYQEKGHSKIILHKGDVIKCPPNIPHWHGASVDTAFVQIAITGREKGATVWLEKVTDQEYNH